MLTDSHCFVLFSLLCFCLSVVSLSLSVVLQCLSVFPSVLFVSQCSCFTFDSQPLISPPSLQDNPPQDRSYVVKDTNNPEYNHKTIFSIDRKSRALARVFKRHSLKFQVYAKG